MEKAFLNEYSFINYNKLSELSLINFNLQTIKNSWFKQNNIIEKITIDGNEIKSLDEKNFLHLKELTEIYLNNNCMKEIGNFTFNHMKLLKRLHMNGNMISNLYLRTESIFFLHLNDNLFTEVS